MSSLPPPGWYDDPEVPSMLRYWDGSVWTDHQVPPPPQRTATTSSGFSDVGELITQSFSLSWSRRAPLAIFVAVGLVGSLLIGFLVDRALENALWVRGGGWTGVERSDVVLLVIGVIVVALASVVAYLAQAHQLYYSRLGVHQPIGASVAAACRATPKLIGWGLVLVVLVVVAFIIAAILTALGVIGALIAIVGMIALAVWTYVKLSFVWPALVVPVPAMSVPKASAAVSDGRFWPVLGRLIAMWLVALAFTLGIGVFVGATGLGSDFDEDALDDTVLVDNNDELVTVDLGTIVSEVDLFGPATVLGSIPSVLASILSLAAVSIMFAETHQVRPDGTPPPQA